MVSFIVSHYKGWAIDSNSDSGHGLIGRYWWFGDRQNIASHMVGHKTALFNTRKEAREALSNVRRAFPKVKVLRVQVDISAQRRGDY